MGVQSFRDLKVWKLGIELVKRVYALSRSLPNSEKFGLISQMQRAAVSVPANVAEGCARSHTREFLHHLAIARGSLAELETYFVIASELGYVDRSAVEAVEAVSEEVSRMLLGLQRSLRVRLKQQY